LNFAFICGLEPPNHYKNTGMLLPRALSISVVGGIFANTI
jgi:hypothetical protein